MELTGDSINLRPDSGRVRVIDIKGGLTAASETALLNAFGRASDAGAEIVLLGFDGLVYMNSAGIGLLVRLVIRAQRQAQQVLAFGLQDHYRNIFELTHLQEVIHTFTTETEALASVMAPSGT